MEEIDVPGTDVPRPRQHRVALAALCASLALLAYLPSLNFGFVNWDDDFHVYRSPVVTGSAPTTARDALLTPHLGYPVPTTVATYRIEHALYGLSPRGYHATNIALHALSTALVFALAIAVGLRRTAAVVAALLFALHPASAEPVSWISGRKDLLATCLALASVLIHLRRPFQWNRPTSYGASLVFMLAVFAKPSVALIPIFALAANKALGGKSWRAAVIAVAPMAVISIVALVLGAQGQAQVGAISSDVGLAGWIRNMWFALGHHTALLGLVHEPLPKYVMASMPPPFSASIDLLPIALMAAMTLSWIFLRRKRTIVVLGWALALLAYVPNSNAIPLVRFLADSYVYLSLAGFGLIAGALVEQALERLPKKRWLGPSLAALMALPLLLGAMQASSAWRDGVALWGKVYAVYPRSPEVCRNYGNAHAELGQLREALEQYLECAGKFDRKWVAKNVGIVLLQMGKREQARAILREAATYHPGDAVIRRYLKELEPGSD